MSEKRVGGRLSDDEAKTFVALLHRFCEYDLDQFELWKLNTAYGMAYTTITREPAPGVSPDAYTELNVPEMPDGHGSWSAQAARGE